MSETIALNELRRLVADWLGQGKRVAGPVAANSGVILFEALRDADQLVLDGYVRPANSIKDFFFPRHEKIYKYRIKGQQTELEDVDPPDGEQVIVGARPCDAASVAVLDRIFTWDYEDKFYLARRKSTVIVTIACTQHDDQCFCTSVGLGPSAEKGSDAILFAGPDGQFEVKCLTDKGKALFAGKTKSGEIKTIPVTEPKKKFDTVPLQKWLSENYESPVWKDIALRCLGCGACAYSCPTCHCFDIVDEGNAFGGARCKNWDSCQFKMFTMHASGHNPRSNQGQRQRQRIQHKFRIYPEKFNEILCTGCGNCTRNCPVGLGVLSALEALTQAAKPAAEVK